MSEIRQVFYVSRMSAGVDHRAVRNILATARRRNRMLDVTGCLTCTDRHFAQVLEGRDEAVDELKTHIAADSRHTGFKLMLDRRLKLREYPLWAMAYLMDPELDSDIEALLDSKATSKKALQVIGRIKPDTVMGAL